MDCAASDEQKQKYLRAVCEGEARSTLALLETSASWSPDAVQLDARRDADHGYRLNGEKLFVADAAVADFLVVVVRIERDLAVLIVPTGAPGLTIASTPGVDLTRRLYRVSFENVIVSWENLVARGADARKAIEAALDVAALGLAAEMVGGMQQLVDLTVAYAKTRNQFGKPIGTFQTVQHQCVDMLARLEGSRSAVYYAAWALSEGDAQAPIAVSVAKAYASEAYAEVGNSSIQVQGGMGFTWENDAHLHYRRAKASELACGDASFHRERIARLLLDDLQPIAGAARRETIVSISNIQLTPAAYFVSSMSRGASSCPTGTSAARACSPNSGFPRLPRPAPGLPGRWAGATTVCL